MLLDCHMDIGLLSWGSMFFRYSQQRKLEVEPWFYVRFSNASFDLSVYNSFQFCNDILIQFVLYVTSKRNFFQWFHFFQGSISLPSKQLTGSKNVKLFGWASVSTYLILTWTFLSLDNYIYGNFSNPTYSPFPPICSSFTFPLPSI